MALGKMLLREARLKLTTKTNSQRYHAIQECHHPPYRKILVTNGITTRRLVQSLFDSAHVKS
jgi:hypothetical protein